MNANCNVNVLNKLADKSQFIHLSQTTSQTNAQKIIPHNNEFDSLSQTNHTNNIGSQLIDFPNYIPTSSSSHWGREFNQMNNDDQKSSYVGSNTTIPAPSNFSTYSAVPQNRYHEQSYDYYNVMLENNEPRSMDFQEEFDELEKELAELELDKDETTNVIDDRELFRDTATELYSTFTNTNSNGNNSISIGTQSKFAGSKFLNMMKLISNGSVNLNQNQTELCSMTTNEPMGNKFIQIPDKFIR